MDDNSAKVLIALLGALASCISGWIAAYYDRKRRRTIRRRRIKPKEE